MRRPGSALAVCLIAGFWAAQGLSQVIDFEGQKVTTATAPQEAAGRTQTAKLVGAGLQADIVYVQAFAGTIEQKAPPKEAAAADREPWLSGPAGIAMVVVFLAVLLALWVYFGGGALLAADTTERRRVAGEAPEGWGQSLTDLGGGRSLTEISAMTDRRAALVRLLRLCLLQGAQATETGFKRSDTEREAFRRLPPRWSGLVYLRRLLVSAELAHYGGRAVDETEFQSLIEGARHILPVKVGGLV